MPLDLLALLPGKVVQAGVIDVASDTVETAEDVVKVIEAVSKFVPLSNIVATTNCGMAPMRRDIAGGQAGGARRRRKTGEAAVGVMFPFSLSSLAGERADRASGITFASYTRLDAALGDIRHSTPAVLTAASRS